GAAEAEPRVYVTSKLWLDSTRGGGATTRAFADTARRVLGEAKYDARADRRAAGLAPVLDLYLIHAPAAGRMEAWREMEDLYLKGHVGAIGVSNYGVHHLDELLRNCRVRPAVNQIEVHPFFQRRDIVAKCFSEGIAVEAYSPLTRGQRLRDPVVTSVARAVGRTPAQVLIRWGLQKGYVTLPKTVNAGRLAENADVFGWEIPPAEMERLDALDCGDNTGWDPTEWK
ncbi:hypothetical protein HK405_015975, partial [Cladochytrium tenue]